MRAVVDPTTIRLTPWVDRTALGAVRPGGRRHRRADRGLAPRRSCAGRRRPPPRSASRRCSPREIEFYLFRDSYEEAYAKGYQGLTPHSPSSRTTTSSRRRRTSTSSAQIRRGLEAAGVPVRVLQGRGRPGPARDQPRLHHRGRDGRPQRRLQERGQGDRRTQRAGHLVHGQVRLRRHRLVLPHPLQPVGRGRRARAHGRRPRRARDERRCSAGTSAACWPPRASSPSCSPRTSTATSASSPARGRRPASAGASTTGRSASARSATARGTRVECRIPGSDANTLLRLRGHDRRRAARHPPPDRAAGDPFDGSGYDEHDLPRIPWNLVDAIELWEASTIAKEAFGDEVHFHLLNDAPRQEWRPSTAA